MSDDSQVTASEEAKLMDKDVLIGFGAVFAVIVLIVILIAKLFGGGAGSVSIAQLDKWALSHNVTVSDGSVPQTGDQSGLVVRYTASDQKIDAMSIRYDPTDEEREEYFSGHSDVITFNGIESADIKRKDWWHRIDHFEQNAAFAKALLGDGLGSVIGKETVEAAVAALSVKRLGYRDPEDDSWMEVEKWDISSVTERQSTWEQESGGLRLRITFSSLMRGQAYVPSQFDIAWGDAEFVEADPIYQDHPDLPYGVRGYPPFTPASVAEHLRNGGVVWAAEASREESWPGQVGYSQFFLYDKTGTKLEERVLASWNCSSELVKSGIKWYGGTHGSKWSAVWANQSMKFVKWDAWRGGALVVQENVFKGFLDGKLNDITTTTTENRLQFTSDRLGELVETTRSETVFMLVDYKPPVEIKSKRQRLVRLTEARMAPDYGFTVK